MSSHDRPAQEATARGRWGVLRIAIYYVLLTGFVLALARYVPLIGDVIGGAPVTGGPSATDIFGSDVAPAVGSPLTTSAWRNAVLATVCMLGALAIMIPVTWVYMVTKRQRGYDESVVHTLLILPIAVTGIVIVVGTNIALAFALAGIVAAVRFRTSLDDTKDAVYIFLAIGVGISSGVLALGVALALSVVFNTVVLVLWSTRFGNIYADSRTGALGLGDVLAGPGSSATALSVGDPAILEAAAPSDLSDIAERAVRFERHISEERVKKKKTRANTLLMIHAKSAQAAQGEVEPILEELAARWKLAEVSPARSGFLLVYLARLDDSAVQGAVMDRLRNGAGGAIEAAELRSLKGINPRA
jgi:hypothetical protein